MGLFEFAFEYLKLNLFRVIVILSFQTRRFLFELSSPLVTIGVWKEKIQTLTRTNFAVLL